MLDADLKARRARALLDDEVLTDVLQEMEDRAIQRIRTAAPEDLIVERARWVVIADIRSELQALVDRVSYANARPGRSPLA